MFNTNPTTKRPIKLVKISNVLDFTFTNSQYFSKYTLKNTKLPLNQTQIHWNYNSLSKINFKFAKKKNFNLNAQTYHEINHNNQIKSTSQFPQNFQIHNINDHCDSIYLIFTTSSPLFHKAWNCLLKLYKKLHDNKVHVWYMFTHIIYKKKKEKKNWKSYIASFAYLFLDSLRLIWFSLKW